MTFSAPTVQFKAIGGLLAAMSKGANLSLPTAKSHVHGSSATGRRSNPSQVDDDVNNLTTDGPLTTRSPLADR